MNAWRKGRGWEGPQVDQTPAAVRHGAGGGGGGGGAGTHLVLLHGLEQVFAHPRDHPLLPRGAGFAQHGVGLARPCTGSVRRGVRGGADRWGAAL